MTEHLELKACLTLFKKPDLGEAERVRDWCHARGARILYPGHADYPFVMHDLEKPPRFLACWGEPVWQTRPSIAMIGSREPTRSALEWMELHVPDFLRKTQALVVSGGARGIDQKAHFLAVRGGHPTLVFLPSGLACPFPSGWLQWKDEVLATGGAIVSTHVPWQEVRRSHFEARNRLIAALARLVFVVEARRRSGSAMTARLARDLGRNICCLPGAPNDVRCAGAVDLLFDGGFPVRDALDLQVLFDVSLSSTRGEDCRGRPG